MTAILEQGNRTARLTANRTLCDFMSPERQKIFGFDEFPSDLASVRLNGETPDDWECLVNDGDAVVIITAADSVTADSIGPESISPPSILAAAPVEDNSVELAQLRARVVELEGKLERCGLLLELTGSINIRLLDLKDSLVSVNEELSCLENSQNRISELISELNA